MNISFSSLERWWSSSRMHGYESDESLGAKARIAAASSTPPEFVMEVVTYSPRAHFLPPSHSLLPSRVQTYNKVTEKVAYSETLSLRRTGSIHSILVVTCGASQQVNKSSLVIFSFCILQKNHLLLMPGKNCQSKKCTIFCWWIKITFNCAKVWKKIFLQYFLHPQTNCCIEIYLPRAWLRSDDSRGSWQLHVHPERVVPNFFCTAATQE